jgi:hypothetical protein
MKNRKTERQVSKLKLSPKEIRDLAVHVQNWTIECGNIFFSGPTFYRSALERNVTAYTGEISGVRIVAEASCKYRGHSLANPEYSVSAEVVCLDNLTDKDRTSIGSYFDNPSLISRNDAAKVRQTFAIAERTYLTSVKESRLGKMSVDWIAVTKAAVTRARRLISGRKR